MNTKVIKRDGSIEDYQEEKIKRVVIATGLTPKQAESFCRVVTAWVEKNFPKEVTYRQIRDKVVERLKIVRKYSADLYIWYEQTKDGKRTQ